MRMSYALSTLGGVLVALTASALPARAAAPAEAPQAPGEVAPDDSPAGEPLRALTPRSVEEAAYLSLSPLSSMNSMQLRLEYTGIDGGGHLATAGLRTGLWMPYVVIPGIEVPRMGSLWVLDLGVQNQDLPVLPEAINGIGDTVVVEQTVYGFSWGGFALGPLIILPSATSPTLGQGKLQLGPLGAIAYAGRGVILTLSVGNLWSVAGPPERTDINTLVVVPTAGVMVSRATYLYLDPTLLFDWKRDGHATIPVNLGIGHAFTPGFVGTLQGEWVTTGDLEDSVTVRVGASAVGW